MASERLSQFLDLKAFARVPGYFVGCTCHAFIAGVGVMLANTVPLVSKPSVWSASNHIAYKNSPSRVLLSASPKALSGVPSLRSARRVIRNHCTSTASPHCMGFGNIGSLCVHMRQLPPFG